MPKKLIELKNIYKSFDDEQVVKNFNLYVNKNEFVTLVGPSGCGKTTTLRMIGGFEFPDSGDIILNGERVNDIPPYHRPINTVFQRYALFPHLSVFDNIAYGLRNFNRVFEDVKSNVRKSYEKEKKALATKLQNKNTTKEEKAEIKYRFKEIKAEIKEKIFDEKEKLYDANLSEIEKRYDKKEKELLDKIEVLENDTVRINNAKDELEKLEEKIDEETSGMKKTERTKVLQKYNKELVIIRKIAYQEDVDELYAELKTVYKYRADEEKSAKSLMMSKHHIKEAVIDALKLVKLSGFQNRKISNMSGGQQQRVAIARALVNKPKILLLDEPLAALDLKLRQNMQYELKEMQRQLGITFIYVTHDQEEALTMSDIVVVMDNGEIQQIGTPQDIYNEPKNRFVASFIGESNIIRAKYKAPKQVEFMGTVFDCTDENFKNGEICDVVIRPEDFDIVPLEEAKLKGIVDSIIFKGVVYEICAIIQGVEFVIHKYEKFEVGDEIGLTVDAFEIHLMKVKKP
ncbi:MAG TPA: ATP-binding cassette domain-containing protein [Acholeplasmataceae bacterium]|nr:ATP-binding cassette domain-containing protein [Acholeplasmataceae bacterium]